MKEYEDRQQSMMNNFLRETCSCLENIDGLRLKIDLNQPLLYGDEGQDKQKVSLLQIDHVGDRGITEIVSLLYNIDTTIFSVISSRAKRLDKEYEVYRDALSHGDRLMFENTYNQKTMLDSEMLDDIRSFINSELADIEFIELQYWYLDKDSTAIDWDLDTLDESEFV